MEIGRIEEGFFTGPPFSFLVEHIRTPDELRQYPFVSVPEGAATKLYAQEVFRSHGLEYEPDMEVTTIELVVQSIRSRLGIAMLPLEYVGDLEMNRAIFRIPVNLPPMVRTACVITSRDALPSPAAQVFLEQYLPKHS